jgi:hypothetical protein
MEIITAAEAPDGLPILWLTADITGQMRNIQEFNTWLQVSTHELFGKMVFLNQETRALGNKQFSHIKLHYTVTFLQNLEAISLCCILSYLTYLKNVRVRPLKVNC